MLFVKTYQGGLGSVSKVTFNIHMDNVRNPIIINEHYCLTEGCTNQTSAVHISDVTYENIKELLPAQERIISDPFCWNAYGEISTLMIPPAYCLTMGVPETIPQNRELLVLFSFLKLYLLNLLVVIFTRCSRKLETATHTPNMRYPDKKLYFT
ncbi:hypothetical protein Vadar_023118 [Vaccinium darrowii]|uniref:Uncharacterized protein n=1 Tax=Vaccinium darrowii TaxID=229202 RepID=A0ACB7XJE8_9ERIC|nr:hypothetical protein Vadar_023118 [Vaccinium darrowii]